MEKDVGDILTAEQKQYMGTLDSVEKQLAAIPIILQNPDWTLQEVDYSIKLQFGE